MNNRNRTINIRELVIYVLKHFVAVLGFMVLGAVLMSGYYWVKNSSFQSIGVTTQEDINQHADQIYSSLPYNEQVAVDTAINDFEDYYNSYELLNESILERIDSYNARRVILTYSIDYAGDINLSGEMQVSLITKSTRLLYYYVTGGSLASELSDSIDINTPHLQDCISAETVDGSGVLCVTVWGTDVDDRIEDLVIASIDNNISKIEADTNTKISLTNAAATEVRSGWIFENQKSWEAEQTKIKNRLDTAVAGLTPDAYDYFSSVVASKYPEFFDLVYPQNGLSNAPSPSLSINKLIKYAAIGVVLGFALYSVYVLFLFMYSKRIISVTDYTDTMGLRIISNTKGETEDLKIAATKITAACDKLQIKELALISTNAEPVSEYVDTVSKMLASNDIKVSFISGFLSDYKKMGELLKNGNCVIVEHQGDSLYSKVYDEVILCNENSVNIIGLVNINK